MAASGWLQPARPIGLYVSVDSEVSTSALRAVALSRGCTVYLPRIVDYRLRRMLFARALGAPVTVNRYGIPEPPARFTINARALAVVFVPVLGFDRAGTRLGSGAGFYDRLFSFRRHSGPPPLLIGLAYACQELPYIAPSLHDVALDAIVTERAILPAHPQHCALACARRSTQ